MRSTRRLRNSTTDVANRGTDSTQQVVDRCRIRRLPAEPAAKGDGSVPSADSTSHRTRTGAVVRPARRYDRCDPGFSPPFWPGLSPQQVLATDKRQPTPTAPTPTPTTPMATPPSDPDPETGSWRGLTIAPEDRCSPYDSDDYSYPQSVEDDIVRSLGGIYSPYTCESVDSDTQTDIEHIVARSEAHDSGLCRADAGTRREFRARPSKRRCPRAVRDAAGAQRPINSAVGPLVTYRNHPEVAAWPA